MTHLEAASALRLRAVNGCSATVDSIVATALASASMQLPVAIERVDWKQLDADSVGKLVQALSDASLTVPRTLLTALLLAGHSLPDTTVGLREHQLLNALNAARDSLNGQRFFSWAALSPQLESCAPELALAILKRVVAQAPAGDACALALRCWRRSPGAIDAVRPLLQAYLAGMPRLTISVSGFSTTALLAKDLELAFACGGRDTTISEVPFGNAIAGLLRPDARADVHVLLLDSHSLLTSDWRLPLHDVATARDARIETLVTALTSFAASSSSLLFVNTLPVAGIPTLGALDAAHRCGDRHGIDRLNRCLLDLSECHSNIMLIDSDCALADIAPKHRTDPKLWFYGRLAFTAEATRALALAFADGWSMAQQGTVKVVAVDFDNTLWGGVYGDDGVTRLECSEEFPGNAFQALQHECLRLKRQGILLVALSKNNPDAMSVFERHPGMVLKADDFVTTAVNWQPKADNIRAIARQLNLSLGSFVFIDDSPHEREAMRTLAPEVIVPELPVDPAQRPQWLRQLRCTWPMRLTEEDVRRSELYQANGAAQALKASAGNIEEYLAGLQQRLLVQELDTANIPRMAQMHQRTNQFNLTTRRLSASDLEGYIGHPRRLAFAGRVQDKFGDHGMVVTATVSLHQSEAEIDTFLMSCRVIGREVENAFLATLVARLAERGVQRVTGRFIRTDKNEMVRDFYASNGFTRRSRDSHAVSWSFDVGAELPGSRFVAVAMEPRQ